MKFARTGTVPSPAFLILSCLTRTRKVQQYWAAKTETLWLANVSRHPTVISNRSRHRATPARDGVACGTGAEAVSRRASSCPSCWRRPHARRLVFAGAVAVPQCDGVHSGSRAGRDRGAVSTSGEQATEGGHKRWCAIRGKPCLVFEAEVCVPSVFVNAPLCSFCCFQGDIAPVRLFAHVRQPFAHKFLPFPRPCAHIQM